MRYPVWNPVHVAIRSPGPYLQYAVQLRRHRFTPPLPYAIGNSRYSKNLIDYSALTEQRNALPFHAIGPSFGSSTNQQSGASLSQAAPLASRLTSSPLDLFRSNRSTRITRQSSGDAFAQSRNHRALRSFTNAYLILTIRRSSNAQAVAIINPVLNCCSPRGALHPLKLTSMGVPHGQ
ncbi:hypothetical protein P692DRAFT_20866850 [Suillus brevipes Sb2]|nr:hypothetical protein P692DRAFT_20866850 [Suillus brevipes Sb2]